MVVVGHDMIAAGWDGVVMMIRMGVAVMWEASMKVMVMIVQVVVVNVIPGRGDNGVSKGMTAAVGRVVPSTTAGMRRGQGSVGRSEVRVSISGRESGVHIVEIVRRTLHPTATSLPVVD